MGMRMGCWLAMPALCFAADSHWIQGHSGQIEIFSDASAKEALPSLGMFEQFRFALGEIVGKPDLNTHPPLRLLVLKNNALPAAVMPGRDRIIIPLEVNRPIPPTVLRAAARLLLEQNVGRLPAGFAQGLETFFSTIDVRGAHVIWGAPPPASERTIEWARVHLIATRPEYYGKLKVLLFNLQRGADEEPAYRNSVGKGAREFEAEAQQYLKAGVFGTADGPSRAFNPQRDVPIKPLPAENARLAMADLLNDRSAAEYQAMIDARVRLPECYEGLGLLALRRKDEAAALENFSRAVELGTENSGVLVAYAKLETDRVKQGEAIEKALELDSKNPEAHYLMGVRKDDVTHLKKATELAPEKAEYWDALALAYMDQNQFVEAGRAWRSAEQAATTPEEQEKMHKAWSGLEAKKLDHDDAEKKRIADERRQDLERVKGKALADLHAAEAKFNAKNEPVPANIPVVSWDEMQTVHLEGVLKQVDCVGKQTVVTIESADQKQIKLAVEKRGALACGAPKKQIHVAVDYSPKADAKLGTAGELPGLQ